MYYFQNSYSLESTPPDLLSWRLTSDSDWESQTSNSKLDLRDKGLVSNAMHEMSSLARIYRGIKFSHMSELFSGK